MVIPGRQRALRQRGTRVPAPCGGRTPEVGSDGRSLPRQVDLAPGLVATGIWVNPFRSRFLT